MPNKILAGKLFFLSITTYRLLTLNKIISKFLLNFDLKIYLNFDI